MKLKHLQAVDVVCKAADEGQEGVLGTVEAEVAFIGKVDLQKDKIMPSAIGKQEVLLGAWGHSTVRAGEAPLGYGDVTEGSDGRVLMSATVLDSGPGRELWTLLKARPNLVQWSITAGVTDHKVQKDFVELVKLDMMEVAPVVRGAQQGTQTLSVKADTDDFQALVNAAVTAAVSAVLDREAKPNADEAQTDDPGEAQTESQETPVATDPEIEARRAAIAEIKRRLGEV